MTLPAVSIKQAYLAYIPVAFYLVYEIVLQVFPGVIADNLMRDIHIDALGLSILSGVYFYIYSCLQIPVGIIFDKFPIKKVIIFPLIICLIGTGLFIISNSLFIAILARLLMGIGSAFTFIGALVITHRFFPAKKFAFLTGITQFLCAIGGLIGNMPLLSLMNQYGWRTTLGILTAIGFAIILFILIYFPNVQAKKIENIRISNTWQVMRSIINNKQVLFLTMYGCFSWAVIPVFASLWGVPFLASYFHLDKISAANANSFVWIGFAIGNPLIGWISDYIEQRKLPLIMAALFGFTAFIMLFAAPQLSFISLAMLLFFIGIGAAGQGLCFAAIRDNSLSSNIATTIGFNNMNVVLIGTLIQLIAGKIIQLHGAKHFIANQLIHYSATDYLYGIILLPICFGFSFLLSLFFIKETNCVQIQNQLKYLSTPSFELKIPQEKV